MLSKLEDHNGEKVQNDLAILFPFVDSESTIRLMCRFNRAAVNEGLEHPILLSAKRMVVVLMLRGMQEDNNYEEPSV